MSETSTLYEEEIIPMTFEPMLKKIFGDPENISIVEEFIASYLHLYLDKVRGHLTLKHLGDELYLNIKPIDFSLNYEDSITNITILILHTQELIQEASLYGYYVLGLQTEKEDYEEYEFTEKTLQINFLNYRDYKAMGILESYMMRGNDNTIFFDKLEYNTVDLVWANELYQNNKENDLLRWGVLLQSKTVNQIKEVIGNDLLTEESKEKLITLLTKYSQDEEMRKEYAASLIKNEMSEKEN